MPETKFFENPGANTASTLNFPNLMVPVPKVLVESPFAVDTKPGYAKKFIERSYFGVAPVS